MAPAALYAPAKDVTEWSSEDVKKYLLRCPWASPEFVKQACLADLDGIGLVSLTKEDLKSTYGIHELGTIKQYIREIRNLDSTYRAEHSRLDQLEFSDLCDMERLQTQTPTFGMKADALSAAGTPLSMKRPTSAAPLTPGRPLCASPGTNAPPTVTTIEEYHEYRRKHGNEVPATPTPKKTSKGVPSYVGQGADHAAKASERLQKLEAAQAEFKATMTKRMDDAFISFDKDERGYLKEQQLESLLKSVFPSFKPSMIREYKELILGEDWKSGDTSGRVSREDFRNAILKRLLGVETAFRLVDEDGTGELEYVEMERLMRECLPLHAPKERAKFVRMIIQECDASGDGRISLDEFVMSQYANMLVGPAELSMKKQKRLAALEDLFATVDTEKLGCVTHFQMKQLVHNCFPDSSEREKDIYLNVIIDECDKDKSGTIDFAEFTQSSYANIMLGMDDEETAPAATRNERDTTMDRPAYQSTTQPPELTRKESNVKASKRGVLSAEEEDADLDPAEQARQRRLASEAEAKAAKEANMSDAAKKAAALQRERDAQIEYERVQQARSMMANSASAQQIGLRIGLLETERRYSKVTTLFHLWDECTDAVGDGSAHIEAHELRAVLVRCFCWTEKEAEANFDSLMKKLDKDGSGCLDIDEFRQFFDGFSANITGKQFDTVVEYITNTIMELSKEKEHERRIMLIRRMFQNWDADESGVLDFDEVSRVLTRYNDEGRDGGEEEFVELFFNDADADNDGSLDESEFVELFDALSRGLSPMEFDTMYYQFSRCIEEVQLMMGLNHANLKYKQLLLNSLEGYEINELLEGSTTLTPLLLYGDSCDPSRAVELAAKARKIPIKAFMVSNERAERAAIAGMQKGFQTGCWVYFIVAKGYDGTRFMRQAGVTLSTSTKSHPRFRLWVWACLDFLNEFPDVLATNSRSENLNEIDPEDTGYSNAELQAKRKSQVGVESLFKPKKANYTQIQGASYGSG